MKKYSTKVGESICEVTVLLFSAVFILCSLISKQGFTRSSIVFSKLLKNNMRTGTWSVNSFIGKFTILHDRRKQLSELSFFY